MSHFTITNPDGDALPIEGEVLFGRGSECTVRLKDSEVSRKHATVYLEEKKLYIRDEGSANGTFVNEARIDKPVSLSAGDKIRMGSTEFTIEVADLEDVTPTVFADDLEIDLPTAKGLDKPWEEMEDLKEPEAPTPPEVKKKRSPLLFIGVGCGVLFLIAMCIAAAFFAVNSLGIFDNLPGDFDLFSGAGRVPEYSLEEVLEQDTVDDRPGVISYLGRPDAFTISEIIVGGSPVRVETWRYFAFGTRVDFVDGEATWTMDIEPAPEDSIMPA
ncbi:MAG: FHA domain-containing protein [Anaerolineales bacterium]|nr:FHA domain-containing protein [Anaerolineales bacterium]